ncbi:MAG: hypothetical protein KDC38_15690, partial [Planctomycetes bacterium]|nr:hypothetical protein [Planctomycetota bacterium]
RLQLLLATGELHARRREWREAAEAYREHQRRAPLEDRSESILELGESLRLQGDGIGALQALTDAWRDGVRHPRLAKNLGGLALAAGEEEAALAWYRRYLDQADLPAPERERVEPVVRRLEASAANK